MVTLALHATAAHAFAPAMDTTLTGNAGERLGYNLAAGDFDGDGYDDLAAGALSHVVVFEGSPTGLTSARAWTGGDWGELVALDANADGYDDLVVPTSSGIALYLGSPTGLSASAAWTYPVGAYPLLAAGDVNGDGYDDLVLADPQDMEYAGPLNLVLTFHGGASGLGASPARTLSGDWTFGYDVGVSDLDGDGYSDVVVANPFKGAGGNLWVYRGSASGTLAARSWTVNGPANYTDFGWELSGGGDLNGDGYEDVAVGLSGAGFDKHFALVRGGAAGPAAPSVNPLAFGQWIALAVIGDTAADGRDELVVGWQEAVYQNRERGGAGLFRSGTSTPSVPDLVVGSAGGDKAGSAVAGGDFDGDGAMDWAVGAWHAAGGAGSVGVNHAPR